MRRRERKATDWCSQIIGGFRRQKDFLRLADLKNIGSRQFASRLISLWSGSIEEPAATPRVRFGAAVLDAGKSDEVEAAGASRETPVASDINFATNDDGTAKLRF